MQIEESKLGKLECCQQSVLWQRGRRRDEAKFLYEGVT